MQARTVCFDEHEPPEEENPFDGIVAYIEERVQSIISSK